MSIANKVWPIKRSKPGPCGYEAKISRAEQALIEKVQEIEDLITLLSPAGSELKHFSFAFTDGELNQCSICAAVKCSRGEILTLQPARMSGWQRA